MLALEDICVLTGATQLNTGATSADDAFARIDPAQAGSARRVWADDKRFGIVAGARNPQVLRERIALLKRQIGAETNTDALDKLRARLGRLYGGLAMIRVGAVTMKAGSARRDQAERMARALQSALSSGVVAGGGASLARVAATLEASTPDAFEARWARDIMAGALRAPLRVIAENAGYDPTLPMYSMTHGAADAVFDVRTGENAGMRAAGVIDPVETLCSAIRVATSMVAMAVTTDALVLRKAPPTSAFP
jgi:chaperonin GroEL